MKTEISHILSLSTVDTHKFWQMKENCTSCEYKSNTTWEPQFGWESIEVCISFPIDMN